MHNSLYSLSPQTLKDLEIANLKDERLREIETERLQAERAINDWAKMSGTKFRNAVAAEFGFTVH